MREEEEEEEEEEKMIKWQLSAGFQCDFECEFCRRLCAV